MNTVARVVYIQINGKGAGTMRRKTKLWYVLILVILAASMIFIGAKKKEQGAEMP